MHKLGYMTAVGALVLALTACSGSTEPEANAGTADATPITSAEPTTEPTTAETASAPLTAEAPSTDEDELFLSEARSRLSSLGAATTIPNATDEQLIDAGHRACDLVRAQTPFNDVSVIEGEPRNQGSYFDSAAITSAAILYYCPEMNGNTL